MPNSPRKIFAFYTYSNPEDEKLYNFLTSQTNQADFIKSAMTDLMNGELVFLKDAELSQRKLKADVEIKEATVRIRKQQAIWWETMKSPPREGVNVVMRDYGKNHVDLIDKQNSVFKCPNCDNVFRWKFPRDLSEKIQYFVKHWYDTHHGDPPEEFQQQLAQLSESLRS